MSNDTYASRPAGGPCAPRKAFRTRSVTPPFRLDRQLAAAVQLQAIGVHYQPQYDAASGRGCGLEALARWVLSTGEPVPPFAFITAAERIGMIHDLGRLIITNACETMRDWCHRGSEAATLSVNVSALQINAASCRFIERTLEELSIPAGKLVLEITESALIADPERTIGYLDEWKRLGVRIAIDDFGTGYSSLDYLTRLPADQLKIDRSLVKRLTVDSKSVAILRMILALATELGLDVVAEGVETELELRMLTDLGCPKIQGYLLARPMPAAEALLALAKTWGNRPGPAGDEFAAGVGEHHAA